MEISKNLTSGLLTPTLSNLEREIKGIFRNFLVYVSESTAWPEGIIGKLISVWVFFISVGIGE
jgi:hypothetical protein